MQPFNCIGVQRSTAIFYFNPFSCWLVGCVLFFFLPWHMINAVELRLIDIPGLFDRRDNNKERSEQKKRRKKKRYMKRRQASYITCVHKRRGGSLTRSFRSLGQKQKLANALPQKMHSHQLLIHVIARFIIRPNLIRDKYENVASFYLPFASLGATDMTTLRKGVIFTLRITIYNSYLSNTSQQLPFSWGLFSLWY